MVTNSFENGEETLLYEPRSFAEQIPNVNPDSPRHFKTKRRRNKADPKLKQRPKSLIVFRKKDSANDGYAAQRSKSLKERPCITVIRRTNSIDSVFGNTICAENASLDMKSIAPNHCKPITARNKVRAIRKTNSGSSNESAPLLRSKSDAGRYPSPNESFEIPYHSTSIQAPPAFDCNEDDFLKHRLILKELNREISDSLDSFKTKSDTSTISSPNSSGFCDGSGTESECDTLSSDNSSTNTGEILFRVKKSAVMNIVYDKDKTAEGKLYSKSLEKNRRPRSITEKMLLVRSKSGLDSERYDPVPLCTTNNNDDVFNMVDYPDCKCTDSGIENSISPHSAPCCRRTNNKKTPASKKKQQSNRQERHKSLADIRPVKTKPTLRKVLSYGRNIRIESVL